MLFLRLLWLVLLQVSLATFFMPHYITASNAVNRPIR